MECQAAVMEVCLRNTRCAPAQCPFTGRQQPRRSIRCPSLAGKVLFVCSGNIDRSPTAEALLRGKEGFKVKSAGTRAGAPEGVSKKLIDWADMIFVMEEHHKEALKQIDVRADTKIAVLSIDDHYLKGDPELTRILKERLSKYLSKI